MSDNALLKLAISVISMSRTGQDPEKYYSGLSELNKALDDVSDASVLYAMIDTNAQTLSLPIDTLTKVFNRLTQLGQRTPRVLEWYASMLKFYGDPEDRLTADQLMLEAKEASSQK